VKVAVRGAGVFARGFVSFETLRAAISGGAAADWASTAKAPRPSLVPARELRRLPDPARLGVEVASQACAMAGVDLAEVVPVFTSTIGDSAITDYMCRTLAGEDKLLSPLRFQNSVHNAPAGSLSILTGNRCPNTFVAAFENSLATALLEAMVLCVSQPRPVLLVCTDVPVPAPLSDVHGEGELGGCALLLDADGEHGSGRASEPAGRVLSGVVVPHHAGATPLSSDGQPAIVQAWELLQALAGWRDWQARLPIGSGSALHLELRTDRAFATDTESV